MNDLIICLLILAMLYYLLVYLPKQQQLNQNTKPLTQTNSTQTEPLLNPDNKALESTLDQLIHNIQQLNKQLN
jgi:hypothetical protein